MESGAAWPDAMVRVGGLEDQQSKCEFEEGDRVIENGRLPKGSRLFDQPSERSAKEILLSYELK